MKSLWNDEEAARYQGELAQRVYTSRLLGRDASLVLHGGGNTSVKIKQENILGEEEELLYVKGSGWDLATIEEAGFSPVRMAHLLKLAKLRSLTDPQMVNELKTNMTKASAPSPSVETILHATLPYKYVDHTHADTVVAITNTAKGLERVQEIYGDSIVIVPYIMPGFDLARLCAEKFAAEATEKTVGMLLMNHGIFSFGETARESYERMIQLVSLAEDYLKRHGAWENPVPSVEQASPLSDVEQASPLSDVEQASPLLGKTLATLRREVSEVAGFPVIMTLHDDDRTLAFVRREDLGEISGQGPATPDHVIRTKQKPLVGTDVKAYAEAYKAYFAQHSPNAREPKTILDPAPRVILHPEWGMCAIGKNAKAAGIVADIYQHTMDVIEGATVLGGYRALPNKDIFDMEYWELEQAKLRKGGAPPMFAGEVALVTGAASGIGKACADALLRRGAAVVGLDINEAIAELYKRPDFCGIPCDVTDEEALAAALERAARTFGGVDILILNAGIFPGGCRIDSLSTKEWRRVMAINLDANLALMRECHPFLKLAPKGGRVAIIGSKNVDAPGPGAAAYSASKAALKQLARVAALEWGSDNIRINSVHPNAVFDTGLWTEEVLKSRAANYGLSVQEYKTNNVLKVEVGSYNVAEMVVEMCGPLFAKTTGAQVPIDGGNDRVI